MLEVPFQPMVMTFLRYYNFGENTTDALKAIKEEYPGRDVVVMNVVDKIVIDLIHPDLVQ